MENPDESEIISEFIEMLLPYYPQEIIQNVLAKHKANILPYLKEPDDKSFPYMAYKIDRSRLTHTKY